MNAPLIRRRETAAEQHLASEPLHVKYRPQSTDDVIGQDATVRSLRQLFEDKRVPHAFLFTGPSGVGKTTLARIVARSLGCDAASITEVDGATHSGVDTMRSIVELSRYPSLLNNPRKFYIVDECHALSKSTWQSLLLTLEEPPDHVYWALCTTEPDKVPQTIRTRCHTYNLKPIAWEKITDYVTHIVSEERLQITPEVQDLACRRAGGSVRQALVYVSMLNGVIDKKQALQLLDEVDDAGEGIINLARMLVSGRGFTWDTARALLDKNKDVSPETIRLTVVNYTASALLGEKSPAQAQRLMAILQAFSAPCNQSEKLGPVLLAVGTLLFTGG